MFFKKFLVSAAILSLAVTPVGLAFLPPVHPLEFLIAIIGVWGLCGVVTFVSWDFLNDND